MKRSRRRRRRRSTITSQKYFYLFLLPLTALISTTISNALLVHHSSTSGGFRGVPGTFCAALPRQNQCCASRNDSCAVPIGGTLCYCDIFCDRPNGAHPAEHTDLSGKSYYDFGDCCPDFWCHCRGERDQCLHGPRTPFAVVVTNTAPLLLAAAATSQTTPSSPRMRMRVSTASARDNDNTYYYNEFNTLPAESSSPHAQRAVNSSSTFNDYNYFDQDAASHRPCFYHDDDNIAYDNADDDHDHGQTAATTSATKTIIIPAGETIRINCNTCKCTTRAAAGARQHQQQLECTQNLCLIEPRFVRHLNRHWQSYGWRAASNYSHYWGHTLRSGFQHRLGSRAPSADVLRMIPVRTHGSGTNSDGNIPAFYDARNTTTLAEIIDQGSCAGSWAFSTAQVAQDRFNIIFHSDRRNRSRQRRQRQRHKKLGQLSAEQLLACDRKRQQHGCAGGHVDRAWWYIRRKGLLEQTCYSEKSKEDWWNLLFTTNNSEIADELQQQQIWRRQQRKSAPRCALNAQQPTTAVAQCPASSSSNDSRRRKKALHYKTSPAYRIAPNEIEIQTEILRSGPVQAVIHVRADFFMYQDGVYRHTGKLAASFLPDKYQTANRFIAGKEEKEEKEGNYHHHAVRIVGWGVDYTSGQPLKYWECANTWGTWWGREGYFRILRGAEPAESNIESFIVAAWPRQQQYDDFDDVHNVDNVHVDIDDQQHLGRGGTSETTTARQRERRRLKKKIHQLHQQQRRERRRRWRHYFSKRQRRLELRKQKLAAALLKKQTLPFNNLTLSSPLPSSNYYYDKDNNQLERLKRLSRAVQRAMHSDSTLLK